MHYKSTENFTSTEGFVFFKQANAARHSLSKAVFIVGMHYYLIYGSVFKQLLGLYADILAIFVCFNSTLHKYTS